MLVARKATAALTLICCDSLVVSLLIKLRHYSVFGIVMIIVKTCVAHCCSKVIFVGNFFDDFFGQITS